MRFRKSSAPAGLTALRGGIITGDKVKLREKQPTDVRNDYRWQSDPELSRLDAAPPLVMSFHIYLLDYTEEMLHPRPHRFPLAIDTIDGKHIGNCTFYDIDEKKGEAQLGIMIGEREYWEKGYGKDAVCAMVHYAFENTWLYRIYLKTLDWNTRAQKCFMGCGFITYDSIKRNGHNFVLMELTRPQWEKGRRPESSTQAGTSVSRTL
jgi:RimJ/RimL family protein N-acetyltransferase